MRIGLLTGGDALGLKAAIRPDRRARRDRWCWVVSVGTHRLVRRDAGARS